MKINKLFKTAGISYLIIFFSAIFANFFVLEALLQNPLATVQNNRILVSAGIMAFLVAVVFDVVVAWALREIYKDHALTTLSTYFRLMHAAIFAVAVFALVATLNAETGEQVLQYVATFNDIWLIGLFFFGIHLILLPKIIKLPKLLAIFLPLAGAMYMIDTGAHFTLENYQTYASTFLTLVAIPSILGEMAFSIWLLMQKSK